MRMRLSREKRKFEEEPVPYIKKKQRSELPRRRRSQISPILFSSMNSTIQRVNSGFSFSMDSSSCSYFGSEVSCDSSRVSIRWKSKARSNLRNGQLGAIEGSKSEVQAKELNGDAQFCRVTGSYYRNKENSEQIGGEVEMSELSCVESNSGADAAPFGERTSKLNLESENVKQIERNEGSEAVSKSKISCVEQVSYENLVFNGENGKLPLEIKENDLVSVTSGVESCYVAKLPEEATEQMETRALEFEFSDISGNFFDANFTVSNSESTVDQKQKIFEFDSDLACTEQFSYEDISEYSSSHETAFSDLQSEFFLENSELEFSDYSPSVFFDSGSEFSERSEGDSTPSHTFSLLVQYREGLSRSTTTVVDGGIASPLENEYHDQATFLRFEDQEDEESYKALRERERRKVFLHNYAEEYCTMEYGDLVLQQRSQMVHWIVEQSSEKKLQQETIFLGVNLLDRFLTKGFFRDKKSLQILGIACLTLATRIEENQPYNSVRQKNFRMGSNVYSRCEVVAMEWLVQEVLNFQCFLPTIFNFLWFYLKASKADAEVEKRAKYLAVLVLSGYEQLGYWPSTVAAVLVILASLESSQDAMHQRVIETHIRTEDHDLNDCIESLEWMLRYL